MGINWTIFDETLDEAVTVIREEFSDCIKECRDIADVRLCIQDELGRPDIDFIKIIALCLAGEVIRGS